MVLTRLFSVRQFVSCFPVFASQSFCEEKLVKHRTNYYSHSMKEVCFHSEPDWCGGTSRTPSPSFLGCSILHRDFFAIAGCNLPRNYLESRNWSMAGRVCRGFAHSEKRNLCDFCLEFLLYVYMLGNVSALQIRRDLIGKLNPRWIYWIVLTRSLGLCGQTVELLRRNRLLRSQLTVRSFHIVIFSSSNALLTNQRLKNSQV